MTAEELLSDALTLFGAHQGNELFSSIFWRAIRDGQLAFCQRRNWGFALEPSATVDTVADTRSVTLASDFDVLFRDDCVRDTDNETWLERITVRQWRDRYYEDGTDTGDPSMFWIVDQTMYFTPVPDDAYTIEYAYYKAPTTPTINAPTLLIPDAYREGLWLLVTREMIRSGLRPLVDLDVTDKTIVECLARHAMHDARRYREAHAGLPRAERTMRHG